MRESLALVRLSDDRTSPDVPAPGSDGLIEVFARFLRLYVADGDASPATIHTCHAQVAQFVAWCKERAANPAQATEEDVIAYRKYLLEAGYRRSTAEDAHSLFDRTDDRVGGRLLAGARDHSLG